MSTSDSSQVPAEVAEVLRIMETFAGRWSLCGGWAVDAWLGRVTREHGDIDFSIFAPDQRALYEHLPGWQLVAHTSVVDDDSSDEWDGRRWIEPPAHFHARAPERVGPLQRRVPATSEDGFFYDIQVDAIDGDDWTLSRDPLVRLPLADAIRESPWGLPTAAPEVLLFFKSRDLRRRDKQDFAALLPLLDGRQRAWLRDALARAGHPWLPQLREPSAATA